MKSPDLILESLTHLPPFPAVLQRVLKLMEDPEASAQDVVEVIQYDQAVTANVLMVCNSAYFGLRRPVYSVRDALVRLGFDRLLEIILSRGSAYLFYRAYPGYDLAMGELWRHSAACALLSQIVCETLHREKTPALFTAALLHDIGKIILHEFVKAHFAEIQRRVREEGRSFVQAEKEVLGVDHAELGGKISERWRFPDAIIAGIRYHHAPGESPGNRDLVSLTHLCDLIALMTGFGGGADGLSYHGHLETMKHYGLREKDLERIITRLEEQLTQVEVILDLQGAQDR